MDLARRRGRNAAPAVITSGSASVRLCWRIERGKPLYGLRLRLYGAARPFLHSCTAQ